MKLLVDNCDFNSVTTMFVGGGYISMSEFAILREFKGKILCADSGCNSVMKAGRLPDVVVGDMDSIDSHVYEVLKEKGLVIKQFPPNKDKLDSEILFDIVNCKGIYLLGFTGTRPDQTFSSYLMLYRWRNRCPFLFSNGFIVFIPSRRVILKNVKVGNILSVLSPFDESEFKESSGLKYSLKGLSFKKLDIYGVSNEIVDKTVTISISRGNPLIFVEYE